METKENSAYIAEAYEGNSFITGELYKDKAKSTFGNIFGRYVKRFFVLDLKKYTFGYYSNSKCEGEGTIISISVSYYVLASVEY
jgi:hypothetical protein